MSRSKVWERLKYLAIPFLSVTTLLHWDLETHLRNVVCRVETPAFVCIAKLLATSLLPQAVLMAHTLHIHNNC